MCCFFFWFPFTDVTGYLQAGALVRERRAEEGGYDAHDRLCHIALQNSVCMLAVTCVVANLNDRN